MGMERRARVIYLPYSMVLDMLRSGVQAPGHLYVPAIGGIPAGCVIIDVTNVWERKCLGVLIHHPDFDPVPEGEEFPQYGDELVKQFLYYRVDHYIRIVGKTEVRPNA